MYRDIQNAVELLLWFFLRWFWFGELEGFRLQILAMTNHLPG